MHSTYSSSNQNVLSRQKKHGKKNEIPHQEVIVPEKKIKALFHCWSHRSELYDASPMIGGHPAGQVSGTFAIVEYEDGTIREVLCGVYGL